MVLILSSRRQRIHHKLRLAWRNPSLLVVGQKSPPFIVLLVVCVAGCLLLSHFLYPVEPKLVLSPSGSGSDNNGAAAAASGYSQWQRFRPVPRPVPLQDRYITLWLHQVHQWFGPDSGQERYKNIRSFLQQAKDQASFTSVMTDLPWEWTERDEQGKLDINSVNKDWMKLACELGLKLQVVITMRELPPWMMIQRDGGGRQHAEFSEHHSPACSPDDIVQTTPSVANPQVWNLLLNYTQSATHALLAQYGKGSCIHSISPTLNNEFETRYSQTHDAMRDFSPAAADRYKEWQVRKAYATSLEAGQEPFPVPCGPICEPLRGENVWRWLAFREEFLADRYIALCRAIKETSSSTTPVKCFLHIGEMLATTDLLNSNIFFHLAKSSAVDELVMDSNMMLSGAPTSPSVVGLMVSTAKLYGKTVHYEVATERVLPCGNDGKPVGTVPPVTATAQYERGAPLLLRAGVQHALEAGIDSLGVTNLCQPALVSTVLPFETTTTSSGSAATSVLKRSSKFQPTAMIFVPYRAFYAFSFLTTGIRCGQSAVQCWHESFSDLPFFGTAGHARTNGRVPKGTCPTDAMQHAVLTVWDDLRLRHKHVVVVGDAAALKDHTDLVVEGGISERVAVTFPCLMNKSGWHFYNGEKDRMLFEAFRARYPFHEHVAPNVC